MKATEMHGLPTGAGDVCIRSVWRNPVDLHTRTIQVFSIIDFTLEHLMRGTFGLILLESGDQIQRPHEAIKQRLRNSKCPLFPSYKMLPNIRCHGVDPLPLIVVPTYGP
jgi:hypothetical protein